MVQIACFDDDFNHRGPLLLVAECVEVGEVCVKDTVYGDVTVQLDEQDDHEVPPAVRGQSVHLRDQGSLQLDAEWGLRTHLQDPLRNPAPLLVRGQLLLNVDEVFKQ